MRTGSISGSFTSYFVCQRDSTPSALRVTPWELPFVIDANAQSNVDIGDLDPPARDGLTGEIGCVAYHLDSVCEYALGYVINGPKTVVVLEEFERSWSLDEPST